MKLQGCFSEWHMDNKFYDLSTKEGRLAVLAAAAAARAKRDKRCKYLVTDPVTFEFKFGCDEERDTDHPFCKRHRDLFKAIRERMKRG